MTLRKQQETWEGRLKELKAYKVANGHCNVPLHFEENKQLGRWVDKQRTYYRQKKEGKKSSMTTERIEKLEALDFRWKIRDSDHVPWEERMKQLKAYRDLHGDCNVPYHHPENKALGKWVSRQREFFKFRQEGLRSSLTDERVNELAEVGFTWKVRDQTDYVPWETRIKELKEYKKKHGAVIVPKNYEANKKLGRWVDHQLSFYSLKLAGQETPLTAERTKELEAIGFSAEILQGTEHAPNSGHSSVLDANWKKRLDELKKYRDEHGDCSVPKRYKPNTALGYWVNTQRKHYKLRQEGKKSTMTDARIEELEKLGFAWNQNEAIWKKRIQELQDYRKEHGHCNVPRNYSQNIELAKWIDSQRKQYSMKRDGKKASITDARVAELEGLGLTWKPRKGAAISIGAVEAAPKAAPPAPAVPVAAVPPVVVPPAAVPPAAKPAPAALPATKNPAPVEI
eukprot:CAMPEP_0113622840 /NCGR_PEP_ID=MMETSP0017_2-20120614/11724_1 /TAXON_ID=2856 /ORGANISM="Cylindrotheca closterium" /LENGTH=453 /DNA_ID=CAMNT_0000532721 /DNA_START=18 /DNA_END=1379 /DNA_ORIENTATION=+ /assembly_acc=CAM_ASM_000147